MSAKMTLTKAQILKLQELAKNATPGPWNASDVNTNHREVTSPWGRLMTIGEFNLQEDVDFVASANPATIQALCECLLEMQEALEFYATYSPRQHPEGYYEIHISPGAGGEDRFGTRAKEALSKYGVTE